jgi:hypothetical protein
MKAILIPAVAAAVAAAVSSCGGSTTAAQSTAPVTQGPASAQVPDTAQMLDTAQVLAQAEQTSETASPYAVNDGAATVSGSGDASEPLAIDSP